MRRRASARTASAMAAGKVPQMARPCRSMVAVSASASAADLPKLDCKSSMTKPRGVESSLSAEMTRLLISDEASGMASIQHL
jgi:hypothetical protein